MQKVKILHAKSENGISRVMVGLDGKCKKYGGTDTGLWELTWDKKTRLKYILKTP